MDTQCWRPERCLQLHRNECHSGHVSSLGQQDWDPQSSISLDWKLAASIYLFVASSQNSNESLHGIMHAFQQQRLCSELPHSPEDGTHASRMGHVAGQAIVCRANAVGLAALMLGPPV